MQATLIYNQSAGSVNQVSAEDLLAALRAVGYEAVCPTTSSEDELDGILRNVRGLVIAAGGDGTIRAVTKRLVGQPVALSILPMGTMNNIAVTLGLTQPPLEIIAGLGNPRKQPLDVGRASGGWGEEYFLEGAGFGFFADLLANAQPDEKSILAGAASLVKTLVNFPNYPCRLRLDDQVSTQEVVDHFVMVEVLNTSSIGPRLRFAPNADPGDGFLDLVRIHAGEEVSFLQYVRNLLTEDLQQLPNVEVTRVRKLEMELLTAPFHIDDKVCPDPQDQQSTEKASPSTEPAASGAYSTLHVEVLAQAIELWLPASPPTVSSG